MSGVHFILLLIDFDRKSEADQGIGLQHLQLVLGVPLQRLKVVIGLMVNVKLLELDDYVVAEDHIKEAGRGRMQLV